MCGFAGFVGAPDDRGPEILAAMGRQLAPRGPDAEGIETSGRLSIVFRRLAIIDVEGGSQPIWNENHTKLVMVNGEIYNHLELRARLAQSHQFRTQSDSEVVLHLYEDLGTDCFQQLDGIFTVCLWDSEVGRLCLARDRMGVKPLLYCSLGDKFFFGSELKALLAHPDCPRTVSWPDLWRLSCHARSMVDPRSCQSSYVAGIDVLAGGEILTREPDGRIRKQRYWSIDDFLDVARQDGEWQSAECTARYRELFEEAVRKQLMSDVPVGVFLSGGLDSSGIVAAAARHKSDLHCFLFVEDTVKKSGDADAAQHLCSLLDLPLHCLEFDPDMLARDSASALELVEYLVWAMGTPLLDPEYLYKHELHRFARTMVPDLKVMLLGQGADEYAGGYSKSYGDAHGSWLDYETGLSRQVAPPDLVPLLAEQYRPHDIDYVDYMAHAWGRLQYFNLWHEDRTSSSQGIEARVPFLDHYLVEFLASIPGRAHAELFWDKRMVRDALGSLMPDPALAARHKVPFWAGPDAQISLGPALAIIGAAYPAFSEEYLTSANAVFAKEAVDQLAARLQASFDASLLERLASCMTISIFERNCREVRDLGHRMRRPSPYAREA